MSLSLLLAAALQTTVEAALIDDRWAERRAHAGALALLRKGPVPYAAVAHRLRPEGPIYRLPVVGAPLDPDADPSRGLLLAAQPGEVAIAPASGRVAYAGRYRRYGDVLILDHGHGWTTVLTGLASIDVPQGAALIGGDPIGRAGGRVRVTLLHRNGAVDVRKMIARLDG